MIKCEYCPKEHDGSYGSGRFCDIKCARGFSSKEKRLESNKKISASLKGRPSWNGNSFKKGFDPNRHMFTEQERKIAIEKARKVRMGIISSTPFENLHSDTVIRRLKKEQDNKCAICGTDSWLGKSITLQLHHKDGNNKNNKRENVELLCAMCHHQTPNWGNKKRKKAPVAELAYASDSASEVSGFESQ